MKVINSIDFISKKDQKINIKIEKLIGGYLKEKTKKLLNVFRVIVIDIILFIGFQKENIVISVIMIIQKLY